MTPGSPFSRTLDSIPVVDGVAVNSIVAVRGAGPAEEGNDGLVTFASAHVADAESELVVRASHSCQGEPQVIAEVRRILLEHLQRSDCAGPSPLGSN